MEDSNLQMEDSNLQMEDYRDLNSGTIENQILKNNNATEAKEPKVGMIFESESEAHKFYVSYAKAKGFGVTIQNSKKKEGKRHWVQFSCHKFGLPKKTVDPVSSQPTAKTNCKAAINITRQFDEKWRVNSIYKEHNHDMDPEKTKYLRCYRNLPLHIQRDVELNCEAGIKISKSVNSFQRRMINLDEQTWIGKDIQNHMDKVKRGEIKGGDAQAMIQYFQKMQADNNDFFYSLDVDEENCLTNVFWADARSREAYKEYSDVVTFDTTYLVNKFSMPFAPFVGVNHHGQSTLLGCGLVTRENTSSFVWLFKAWLNCMSNVPPDAIITDQDRAMQNAISQVFPNTRHRWCLWHIMKKLPDKFTKNLELQHAISSAIYDSLTIPEFEDNWTKMIEYYNLSDNDWLCTMYDERNRWIPAFVCYTFWAGMSTTQRSESINAYFDNYVHPRTSLKEFVEQYENALRKKVEDEEEADAMSMNSQYPLWSLHGFEQQFHNLYTRSKYRQLRVQLQQLVNCEMKVGSIVDGVEQFFVEHTFEVDKAGEFRKTVNFSVHFCEKTGETNCVCRMFESKGMVCAHMLRIWTLKKLSMVPKKYLLRRWCKNVLRSHTKVSLNYTNRKEEPEWRRFDELRVLFNHASNESIFSDTKTNKLKDILTRFIDENKQDSPTNMLTQIPRPIIVRSLKAQRVNIGDPIQGVKKGRPDAKRKISRNEALSRKRAKKVKNHAQKNGIENVHEFDNSQKSVYSVGLHEPTNETLSLFTS